jgi:hypothetical protein
VGKLPYYGWIRAVATSGTTAYVGADRALVILDVSAPEHPVMLGEVVLPSNANTNDVALAFPYAYVADSFGGLRILDVSVPAAPVEVGFYETPGYAYGVAVNGSRAYVAGSDYTLRVVNVSNPTAPIEVGYYTGSNFDLPRAVAVSGAYAYVAWGHEAWWC